MTDITLADAAALCRNLGHAWDPIAGKLKDVMQHRHWQNAKIRAGKKSWEVVLQCPRCTTKRYFLYNQENKAVCRKYVYPVGYKETRVPTAEMKTQLRIALKVWGSEDAMEMWQ